MSDDFNDLISLKKELNKVQQSFREQVFLIEKRLKKIEDIQSSENDNSLSSLKKELKKIKESFREQIFLIENKLKNIEKKNEKDKKNIEDIGSLIKASEEIIKDKADKVDKKPLYNVEAVKKATLKQDKNSKEKSKLINQSQVKELAENIVLDSILGVFSHFTTFASKIYKHYKKEDKLAIFFMTLLGVIIFLFGAGFFLIYSFENIETSYRIMIGLLASFAFLYSGHYLSKKEEYKDYASSLLAVSVILNYLLIYFSTVFLNEVFTSSIGFIFIIINLLLATALSLRYKTKVVAIIVLFGGAFSPFFLENTDSSIAFYLTYLLLIASSSLFISKKINWDTLKELSFIVVLVITEILIFTDIQGVDRYFYILFVHLFSYVFLYYNFFDNKKLKQLFNKKDFLLLISTILMILINSYYIIENLDFLGIIYLVNSLFFLFIAFKPGIIEENSLIHVDESSLNIRKIKSLMIVISGAFLAVTAPALLGQHLIGIFWALEAVLIIYISFLFDFTDLRKKAYLFFGFSCLKISEFTIIFIDEGSALNSDSLLSLVLDWTSLFLLLFVLGQIIKRFDKAVEPNDGENKYWENSIVFIINEFLSIFGLILFLVPLGFYIKEYTLVLSFIPMLALLFWANKKKLFFSLYLGFSLFLSVFIAIFFSMLETNSYHFRDQLLYGKIAIFELALILFFLQVFFKKINYDGVLLKFSKFMRTVFLLVLPFAIISPIKRRFPSYLIFSFWAAVVVNFIIYDVTKRKSSKIELFLLTCIVSITSFSVFILNYFIHKKSEFIFPDLLLILGLLLLLIPFFIKKAYLKENYNNPNYSFLFTILIHYINFYIFIFSFLKYQNLIISTAFSTIYLLGLIILKEKLHIVKNTLLKLYRISQFTALLFFIFTYIEPSFSIIENTITFFLGFVILLLFYVVLFTRYGIYYNLDNFMRKLDVHIFHIFILFFYSLLIFIFIDVNSGIVLTTAIIIHGITIIFISLKKEFKFLTKLSISFFIAGLVKLFFLDLSNSSLVNKMIVFIFLGLVLLLSAFGFQKIKTKMNEDKLNKIKSKTDSSE